MVVLFYLFLVVGSCHSQLLDFFFIGSIALFGQNGLNVECVQFGIEFCFFLG